MADVTELRGFARLEAAVGGVAALKLCAFFGGQTLYVPLALDEDHLLVNVIGSEAAGYLVAELGGQDVSIPACEMKALRRAGKLRHQMRRGNTPSAAGAYLGITSRHARRLAATLLRLEGYSPKLLPPESEETA